MFVVKPFFTEMPQSRGALMKRSTGYGSLVTHSVLLGLYWDQALKEPSGGKQQQGSIHS